MKLQELVPSLNLCKEIPEGAFADSALVWFGHDKVYCGHDKVYFPPPVHSDMEVVPRNELGVACYIFLEKDARQLYPAPTLEEIMAALNDCGNVYLQKDDDGWMIMRELPGDDEGYGYEVTTERAPDNPATAALKLWLEINKKEKDD